MGSRLIPAKQTVMCKATYDNIHGDLILFSKALRG